MMIVGDPSATPGDFLSTPGLASTGAGTLRLSIKNQIVIPIVGIQGVAICALTMAGATLAARRTERQIIDRLGGVVEALGHANFPYTAGVLARMRDLSGAEFVASGADGRVTATSLATLADRPPSPLDDAALDALGGSPAVTLDGVRYFAVRLRSTGRADGTSLLVLYPETTWRQARREAATLPLVLGGCSLALMVTVTSWIAHRISRRLRRITRQVARIADGAFEELDVGGERDEVADLARSINVMCVRLEALGRAIRRTERTRLLAQLAAGLAHQLRNSLTGARMSIQLHARRCTSGEGDRALDVALRQLAMTEEQVKGLLSLGRVERQAPAACDLDDLLAEVASLVGPACEHAKVGLRAHRGEVRCEVTAEATGLRAAVLNLTLNAIEAAGHGGVVRLEARTEGDEVAIEVSDNGPGPPPGLAASLFEPFATGKPEGVGLGLALAREVAEQHGGGLTWARDGDETRFRLTLPRAAGPVEEAAWAAS